MLPMNAWLYVEIDFILPILCCWQKLRNKMDTAREGGERGLLDETRVLVNEHVVKNVHSASNSLFSSQPIQAFKKFIEENTK